MRGPSPEGTALPFAQPGTGEEAGWEDSRLAGCTQAAERSEGFRSSGRRSALRLCGHAELKATGTRSAPWRRSTAQGETAWTPSHEAFRTGGRWSVAASGSGPRLPRSRGGARVPCAETNPRRTVSRWRGDPGEGPARSGRRRQRRAGASRLEAEGRVPILAGPAVTSGTLRRSRASGPPLPQLRVGTKAESPPRRDGRAQTRLYVGVSHCPPHRGSVFVALASRGGGGSLSKCDAKTQKPEPGETPECGHVHLFFHVSFG